jgi:hypothetical protein
MKKLIFLMFLLSICGCWVAEASDFEDMATKTLCEKSDSPANCEFSTTECIDLLISMPVIETEGLDRESLLTLFITEPETKTKLCKN